ncbi:MAG: MmpS family protein, partial [Mycobacterium sp.]|nr:MmpS family protein [Mycobacterium sp.]
MYRAFKKVWIPLLLAAVITLGAYVVIRIRDTFGANAGVTASEGVEANTKPFNP